jgi:epoxyqueuosine reductase
MDIKALIADIADSMGFQRAVIASLEPMDEERRKFEQWLEQGYAAGMEYLKRNPHFRTSPQLLYPSAKSAIVLSASYFTDVPPDPGPHYGLVARYAVGLDYHDVLPKKLAQLKDKLESALGRSLMGQGYTDNVPLYEQALAKRHGLGFAGKNTMIIGPKLSGSYNFVAELFTDIELSADEPYLGTCGQCFRCGAACPTKAIVSPNTVDAGLCISYLTIENKGPIPNGVRESIGRWVFGCDICQEVCPYNQKPPKTNWKEFQPDAGVGHYLELFGLLKIKTQSQFKAIFGHTALSRPKRRGLLRNALIVLGNKRPEGYEKAIFEFAQDEEDAMLREHAYWSLVQSQGSLAKKYREGLLRQEINNDIKSLMQNLEI